MQDYIVMCTHIVSLTLLVPSPGLLVVGNLPDVVLVKREHAVTTLHSTGHCTRSAGQQWNSWIRALDTEQYQLMATTLPQLFIGGITERIWQRALNTSEDQLVTALAERVNNGTADWGSTSRALASPLSQRRVQTEQRRLHSHSSSHGPLNFFSQAWKTKNLIYFIILKDPSHFFLIFQSDD